MKYEIKTKIQFTTSQDKPYFSQTAFLFSEHGRSFQFWMESEGVSSTQSSSPPALFGSPLYQNLNNSEKCNNNKNDREDFSFY